MLGGLQLDYQVANTISPTFGEAKAIAKKSVRMEKAKTFLGPVADLLLWRYYRERFLPLPLERPALEAAPSTRHHGVEVFLGSRLVVQNRFLQLVMAEVTEILADGSFRLSSGHLIRPNSQEVVL